MAAIAGVSVGTVDRVLHDRGEVAEKTRKKVLRAIKELDYTPNIIARSLALKKLFRIGVLLPEIHSDNDYWNGPLQGVEQAARELTTYKIRIDSFYFHHPDPSSFEEKATEMIQSAPDGVMFPPLYEQVSLKLIDQCAATGIPFVLFDSNLDTDKKLSFIGQNSFQSGKLAGKLMHQLVGWKEGAILVLMIGEESSMSNQVKRRMNGFFDFFLNESAWDKSRLFARVAQKDARSIRDLVHEYTQSNRISGVFIPNSRAYLLCEAVGGESLADICIIGYDLLEKNIEWLEKGTIDFLIAQNPRLQGYKAVMELFDHLVLKKEVRQESFVPIDIIMKENYQYYLL